MSDLFESLTGKYEFRDDELPLVDELCRLVGDLERIRGELEGRPLLVAGSKGQEVVDPLRGELHRTSTRIESLVRTLGIPDDDDMSEDQRRSWAGRNLARQRWG